MSAAVIKRVPVGVWVALALIGATALGWYAFSMWGSKKVDPLGPSSREEIVLRTLRLAGIEHAVIGSDTRIALLRMDLAGPASPPDVEIAWQTAFAALAGAYGGAEGYVVQIFADGAPLVELSAPGGDVRDAVRADDPIALRRGTNAAFIAVQSHRGEPVARERAGGAVGVAPVADVMAAEDLMAATPVDATPMPESAVAVDAHLSGGYLDAKNRAAGLLDDGGPTVEAAERLAAIASAMRLGAPAVIAPGAGESALARFIERLGVALEKSEAAGVDGLREEVETLSQLGDRASGARVRSLLLAAEALADTASGRSLLADTVVVTREVARAPLEPGPPRDALLAATGSPEAARDVVDVRALMRDESLDVTLDTVATGAALPARVLRLHARGSNPPALMWGVANGNQTASADVWLGYRRSDGAVFWLAGPEGQVALTDGSVRGWAYARQRAALVEAAHSGHVLAYFGTE
ncbi:MAG: hypothetical protein RBS78_07105 [Coriobacteriia bacterium]|nr:hypothetical protein [Coriobacteriia bacterium]